MRQFRFRLDPVIRLKEYQIERKEEEISEIDAQMERLIGDIESGRQAVQDMRHRVLEETPDEQLIHAERTLDQFRSYMMQVEAQKRKEIESLEEKKEAKRQELVTLYQEEKILDRYKEKKRQDWQKNVQREENLLMDELGTQNFVRRKNEHGGVMLYLLLPILLAGAAAGLGWYFNVIDQDTLRKIPYVKSLIPASATGTLAEQQVASTPSEPTEALTWEQMLGDPDQPMPELLSNIAKERENLNKIAEQLAEREKALRARERQLEQQEQRIADMVNQVSEQITVYKNLKKMREEALKSEESQRVENIATALSQIKRSDEIPQMMVDLFDSADERDQEKVKKNKMLVLRIIRSYPEKQQSELFAALAEANPATAAEIVKAFITTPTDEVYGLTVEDATGTASAGTGPVPAGS